MTPRYVRRAIAAVALLAASAGGQTTGLTLRHALTEADHAAYAVRIATGNAGADRARSLAPLRGILPSLRLEAGLVRTTDPIGTFGATLRQRAITTANFDPRRLNHPEAVSTYQGGVVIEQPVLDAAAWAGRRAALRAADATRATEAWVRLATRTDVIRAFYGAILASEQVRTLQDAATAARAHVKQAEALVRNGAATRADALLASVRASEIETQLLEASGAARTSRRQLGVVLGRDEDDAPELTSSFPTSDRIRDVAAADTIVQTGVQRADVEAAARGVDAARADAARAYATLLPRLNSFARYDWYAADRPYAGEKTWTVGVMASWSLFAGASELSEVRTAGARADVARAAADAVAARARLELDQSRVALSVALARLEIAERAVTQSAEAHRILARKYQGGLATITELLDAQAVATGSALALSHASYGAIVAAAERRQALGLDPQALVALDDHSADRPETARRAQ
jgi:outer membrane protein TolC